ncbi:MULTISPECIES: hypothetical protein [unclassified Wenzhouxiangella]|uniref:hypothetical protein n=1 Tax=unclassified Wenzhouxiangella TaxID=2613841 RepID=UPI000E329D88|nr:MULTISPECIES: hypothetical protein [unclassified Wenzhouxiangella]RFF28460.1 hypothetical protein DZK25_02680 [Wenzhouxiangella sp. 15181]RFP69977.1 hypothetical protein DZK26_01780 [Wenzhouxiangella sp. 15190]
MKWRDPFLLLAALVAVVSAAVHAGDETSKATENQDEDKQVEESAADEQRAERQARQQRLMEMSCRDEEGRPEGWLDLTHSYLNQRLCEPAAWFDGFFGDPRTLEENPVGSFVRLRNAVRWDEHEGWQYRVGVRANVILPRLSERVRLLVARDEDLEGDYTDPAGAFDDPENQTRLGLRFLASEHARSRFDVDGTVRVSSGSLNPRLRGRYRYIRGLTDRTLGRFTQSAFWEREEGLGLTTRLDWEWLPDRNRLLRWSGRGTWSEKSDGIDWRTGLVSFQQLDMKSAIRAEVGAWGYTEPEFETEEYFVALRYRRQFLRHWLYYEIEPAHAWPKDFDTGERRSDWRLTFTLEIQFENERSRQHRLRQYLDEEPDAEAWEDEPIPVDAPGDRADDPVLEDKDNGNGNNGDESREGGG